MYLESFPELPLDENNNLLPDKHISLKIPGFPGKLFEFDTTEKGHSLQETIFYALDTYDSESKLGVSKEDLAVRIVDKIGKDNLTPEEVEVYKTVLSGTSMFGASRFISMVLARVNTPKNN